MLDRLKQAIRWLGWIIVPVVAIVIACGEGAEGEPRPEPVTPTTPASATGTPTPPGTALDTPTPEARDPTPPEIPSEPGLLIYRDNSGRALIALDVESQQEFRLPYSGTFFPLVVDCTVDAFRALYVSPGDDIGLSQIIITGEDVPDQPIDIQGDVQGAVWSPLGDQIAVKIFDREERSSNLMLLDAVTGETTLLPSGLGTPGPPTWSPDGKQLAFAVFESGESRLHVLGVGMDAPVRISDRSPVFSPDWSPDGRALLFGAPAGDDFIQLFLVGPDGTNDRQLTGSETAKASPRWSNDGSLIAFAGTILLPQVSRSTAGLHNLAVWVANADGTDERAITDVDPGRLANGMVFQRPLAGRVGDGMTMRTAALLVLALAVATLAIWPGGTAHGHALLVRSDPPVDARLLGSSS